jgi:hypothetical protein
MSETAFTVIKSALQEILVQASEQQIEGDEFKDGALYLNRMMSEFDAAGISLGYTKVSDPNDPITVPDGAINGIVFNLAIRLAQSYDEQVSSTLAIAASEGLIAMRNIGVTIEQTGYGGTLPIGSGNEGDNFEITHYYDTDPDRLLTETNGNILLETDS